jgi:hypothetical protein
MKKKPWKNNAKHLNKQAQKKGFASKSFWRVPTAKRMTNKALIKNDGEKKNKQKTLKL